MSTVFWVRKKEWWQGAEWKKCSNMKNLEIFTYREKKISMKAIGQIVNIFCEHFCLYKSLYLLSTSSIIWQMFFSNFPQSIFLLNSHISPSYNITLWLWNPILFFTCSSFYKMVCFLKKLFRFRGESAVLHGSGSAVNNNLLSSFFYLLLSLLSSFYHFYYCLLWSGWCMLSS